MLSVHHGSGCWHFLRLSLIPRAWNQNLRNFIIINKGARIIVKTLLFIDITLSHFSLSHKLICVLSKIIFDSELWLDNVRMHQSRRCRLIQLQLMRLKQVLLLILRLLLGMFWIGCDQMVKVTGHICMTVELLMSVERGCM